MHFSLELVRFIGYVKADYAWFYSTEFSWDYACIGWQKIAQNWTDFMTEMLLNLGQNNLLSWEESMPYNLTKLGLKTELKKD